MDDDVVTREVPLSYLILQLVAHESAVAREFGMVAEVFQGWRRFL